MEISVFSKVWNLGRLRKAREESDNFLKIFAMLAISSLHVSSTKSTPNKTQSGCLGALHSTCICTGRAVMPELHTSWLFSGAVMTWKILIPLGINFPLSWLVYTIITVVCATWPRLWGWLATKKLKSLLLAQQGTLCWECQGPKCLQTHFFTDISGISFSLLSIYKLLYFSRP